MGAAAPLHSICHHGVGRENFSFFKKLLIASAIFEENHDDRSHGLHPLAPFNTVRLKQI